MYNVPAPAILNVGVTVTTSGTSASTALPANGSASNAGFLRVVRVVSDTSAFIKFGKGTVTATANDILVTSTPAFFNVNGCDHFGAIQNTAGAKVSVTPVE